MFYNTRIVKTVGLLVRGSMVLALLLSAASAQAQWWGRQQQQQQNQRILPPENTYASARSSEVEPTPEISGADQNTFFDTFSDYDVFEPLRGKSNPYAGLAGASGIVNLSIKDIVAGITDRDLSSRYNQWRTYLAGALKNTEGVRTASELNGLGRLTWYEEIMADPLKGAGEAEEFTRSLHMNLCSGREGFQKGLKRIASRMDVDGSKIQVSSPFAENETAVKALAVFEKALVQAHLCHGRAIAGLSQDDLKLISTYANRILTVEASVGHTVAMRGSAKQQIMAMQKIDQGAMYEGLAELSILMDCNFIRALDKMEDSGNPDLTFDGVTGSIAKIIETQAGMIIVGGRSENVYDIEKMSNVCAIIDLGGDDTYIEGVVNLNRPVLAILDVHGNDTYRGQLPGIQGSCLLGISLLVDAQGDDTYTARNHAQGSAMAGACALVDFDGDDRYNGVRRVQGTAVCGVGVLIDRHGNDSYHAAMWSQGTGQTLGCGVLEDCTGDDVYYTGGMYYDSYPETPGYEGWGQGLGTGIRGVAAGGIGVLLEGAGDDKYEFDYIAHGGGYWMGLGFFRDFDGNDIHQGSTSVMWDGSPRRESKFQRFSSGFGCHYAAGFFFEDTGNDTYWASIMSQGFAWDCGVSFLYDFLGDDVITGNGGGNQGQGAQASIGVLVNFSGDDNYKGSTQGYASGNITYHDLPNCGGNFSFFLDYAGTDVYGCRAKNNSSMRRGTNGGFLVDRPSQKEYEELKNASAATNGTAIGTTSGAGETK